MRFEIVEDEHRKFPSQTIKLPERASVHSAGYDFKSNEWYTLLPNAKHIFWTDIKCNLEENTFLMLVVRSSYGINKSIRLANTIGIIDKDYYNNENNDGNIGICLYNYGLDTITIELGDRIAQGIVIPTLYDKDKTEKKRIGGIGSTNE